MWPGMIPDDPMKDCPDCKGNGKILLFNHFTVCDVCGGKGQIKVELPEKKEDDDDDLSYIIDGF